MAPLLLRPAHRSAAPAARAGVDLLLVGGVPGAGKSTAIAAAAPDVVGATVLDPDALRGWFAARLPAGTPYQWYRPLCHTLHALAVLALLLLGPRRVGRADVSAVPGRPVRRRLLVHDPSTRPGRLRLLGRLANARGWSPFLLYVDTDAARAREGQHVRGRIVDAASFAAHVERWCALRDEAATGSCAGWPCRVTDRDHAAAQVRRALTTG